MNTQESALTPACFEQVLARFEQVDRDLAPGGLYSIREHAVPQPGGLWPELAQETALVVLPALRSLGCNPMRSSRRDAESGILHLQPGGALDQVQIFRISTVKVRKYGSAYRVDPHFDFSGRWEGVRLGAALRSITQAPPRRSRLVILVAFVEDPGQLEPHVTPRGSAGGVNARWARIQRTWDDPHGRGFVTSAVLWWSQTASVDQPDPILSACVPGR